MILDLIKNLQAKRENAIRQIENSNLSEEAKLEMIKNIDLQYYANKLALDHSIEINKKNKQSA